MEMAKNPKVSVIIATYRRDSVLERSLKSLAIQTYTDFEIIIVDDNDQEEWNQRVEKIVCRFKNSFPNMSVEYIQNHPNLGSARTRNVGIERSNGEYVCFLDDDDVYLAGRIENQVYPMMSFKADYGVTDLSLYSESEKLIEKRTREYIKDTSYKSLMKYHLLHHITGTDTMMFRRDYLMKIGGFSSIDVGDEFYLMEKAIKGEGKFIYTPVCDVKAYVHTGDEGLSSGPKKIEGERNLYKQKILYFSELDGKSVRYIKMRHHAVLAYAYLRMNKYLKFFTEGISAFCYSPVSLLKLFFDRNH